MTARLICGDVGETLASLPDASVQCCVTSPPYFGLRDYGVGGQIGLESSPAEFIRVMVGVFAEVRRVLRPDGIVFLNIGDSYMGKNLMLMPARVALALQSDGWWVRSEIIWAKPNPMPESVRDRLTVAHEHIWMLTKSARYFYDAEAIRMPAKNPTATIKMPDGWDSGAGAHGSFHRNGREKGERRDKQRGHVRVHAGFNDRWDAIPREEQIAMGANARTVWEIATVGFAEAHFATFPPEIPRRCILAGTSERGQCPACGAPWRRMVERSSSVPDLSQRSTQHYNTADRYGANNGGNGGFDKLAARMREGANGSVTTGWQPTCTCDAGEPVPQTVLDPFVGSGTTAMVALRFRRSCIGIDLNPEYIDIARRRIVGDAPLLNVVEVS